MPARTEPFRSDPELIRRCIEGDQAAWDRLVDQYGRLVYSIPRGYGMSADDADDVFQNVFVIVYRKLSTLKDLTRLSSWLITTTHRECWRLRRSHEVPVEDDLPRLPEEAAPDDVERWERQQTVRELLDRLGDPCRALLTALFLDSSEPSYARIAERLGIPVGSIGPTRARCFRKLEKLMRSAGFDPLPTSS